MPSTTALALTGFITWALALLVLMEILRSKLVVTGAVAPNQFVPDNANLSPFMQRLARAHANCIEGLPIFGGLMLVALATERTDVTDGLTLWVLGARIVQSTLHLASLKPAVVTLRFLAFVVQMVIAAYWTVRLLMAWA